MAFSCRICGNIDDNRTHRAREMMFGTRDEFDYVECGGCGTLQIAEVPDLAPYYPENYFSFDAGGEIDLATDWKRRLASRFAGDYFLKGTNPIGKFIVEKKPWIRDHFPDSLAYAPLGLDFGSHILDFGCGAGRLLQTLHYFGFRDLTGADAFIEKDIFYPKTGVNIYKRALDEIEPFFDLVMLHHTFEHLPEPLEALRQIHRLLKPGKFCLLRIPVINYAWEKYGVNWVQMDPPRHLFLYTERAVRALAEQAEFELTDVIYDSGPFQFWGSEQYLNDIPLTDPRSFNDGDISKTSFTQGQIDNWTREAEGLNREGRGDQAGFYLRRKG
jgi:SAM-dependent methyltransferase